MTEIARVECCRNCKYCKTLYVPPAKYFDEVIKAVGGGEAAYVCSVFIDEYNSVQYLGDDNGMCEMFTEKEIADEQTATEKGV